MKRHTAVIVWCLLAGALLPPQRAAAQIRIRFRPFLGVGASVVSSRSIPDMLIEDAFDQLYYDRNYLTKPGPALRVTARCNVISVYDVSLGYQFWGHRHTYPEDAPDNMLKVGVMYPASFTLSMHAVTLQWSLPYRYISSSRIVPYLLGGYGTYYGTAKKHHYEWIDTEQTVADKFLERSGEFDGYGFMLGAGAVLFEYVFLQLTMVDLQDRAVPHNRFIELTAGVTL